MNLSLDGYIEAQVALLWDRVNLSSSMFAASKEEEYWRCYAAPAPADE